MIGVIVLVSELSEAYEGLGCKNGITLSNQ